MTLVFISGVLYIIAFSIYAVNRLYLYRNEKRAERGPVGRLPSLSILIPARNEAGNLSRLLPEIFEQDYADFEVVVVDDASTDGTADVLAAMSDPRLRTVSCTGPPSGWAGKVHALYKGSTTAQNDVYLFLDADAELPATDAIARMMQALQSHGPRSVVTGLARWTGGGRLLVSLLPVAILFILPWPLGHLLPFRSLTAMNGQIWMIRRSDYHSCEPHLANKNSILEDVTIGRYLKGGGFNIFLHNFQDILRVPMYESLKEAWNGLRRNAALITGDRPLAVLPLVAGWFAFILVPLFLEPLLLIPFAGIKLLSDRFTGNPWWVTALVPVSAFLGPGILLHSAFSHVAGDVTWKGRSVSMRKRKK